MNGGVVKNNSLKRERRFRQFQIEKFDRRRSVPCVSMTVDIDVTRLQERRRLLNRGVAEGDRISVTHVLVKAASIALTEFPVLYGLFDGRKVIPSPQIRINLPVSEDNHVEYVIVRSPDSKSVQEIATEIRNGAVKIRSGVGEFYQGLKLLFWMPRCLRKLLTNFMPIGIRLAYNNYGNFPITNFGSFGVKNGTPVLSSPMIAVLCCGMIQLEPLTLKDGGQASKEILPVTLVFDHRPIDGAYGGRFLSRLKQLMESEVDTIFG